MKLIQWYRDYQQKKVKKQLGGVGKDCNIFFPCGLGNPSHVFLGDYTLVQSGCTFIIYKGNVIIKKYSSVSCNGLFVTGNHCPTVGVNQRALGRLHINDIEKDIIIEQDCWCGANVTFLSGTHIGRGSIVAAGALVNKSYPPYAVLAGIPARIIATKFTFEQAIEHEKKLYCEEERISDDELRIIFETYYKGLRSIGVTEMSDEDRKRFTDYENERKMQYDI